jgi:hypothetical protein
VLLTGPVKCRLDAGALLSYSLKESSQRGWLRNRLNGLNLDAVFWYRVKEEFLYICVAMQVHQAVLLQDLLCLT